MIRWMEALVERAGAAGSLPTIQKLWPADRQLASGTLSDPSHPRSRVNRTLNFVLALLGLVAMLPVLLLTALMIRLTSRGPVLYTQVRIGLDRRLPLNGAQNQRRERDLGGQPFTMYKFRTMRVDAEHHSGAVWAAKDDPRVTSLGRLLRQYRLDELPQLLNVLKGEMNILGPRPERPLSFTCLRPLGRRSGVSHSHSAS